MSANPSSSSSLLPSTSGSQNAENGDERNSVVIKVGMVGDSQIGKTSLMVKYVEGSFDEDYIQTLGVNFMEKTISVRRTTITFSIWDLGGQREFVNMLPLVCNDAVAILFMFDLSRKSTLNSVKEWYRQARGFNKTAIPFLIGTKFDQFATFPRDEQEEITKQAKRFAKAMHASLIFCSTSASINVQKIFKIVLAKAFDLKCVIPEIEGVGEPILIYVDVGYMSSLFTCSVAVKTGSVKRTNFSFCQGTQIRQKSRAVYQISSNGCKRVTSYGLHYNCHLSPSPFPFPFFFFFFSGCLVHIVISKSMAIFNFNLSFHLQSVPCVFFSPSITNIFFRFFSFQPFHIPPLHAQRRK